MTDYFQRLQEELHGALQRQTRQPPAPLHRRAWTALRVRPAIIVAVTALIAVPTAAAVTGLWPQREPDGLVRLTPQRIIASGDSPEFGAWEATASTSDRGNCFGLRLLDPPGPQGGTMSEGCGTASDVAVIGGGSGPPMTGVFGFAPDAATHVRVENAAGQSGNFPTYRVDGRRERFFFASLPNNDRTGLQVVPLANGRELTKLHLP